MQRLLRILVVVLAVMPLAMPGMRWYASARCAVPMAAEHLCCPQQHAEVATPSCCHAKTDALLAEGKTTLEDARLDAGSQLIMPMPRRGREEARASGEASPAYISILLPALILRT